MIVSPDNWMNIGRPIKIKDIEDSILRILSEIDCNCLSLSGGLDSSLILFFMLKIHTQVRTFTIGYSESHPDIKYSRMIVSNFKNIEHKIYIPTAEEKEFMGKSDSMEDETVKLFYRYIKLHTKKIIACDGIDEFMCGYYKHQENPDEKTYYNYIRQLKSSQLIPLDQNSGDIEVYLPYLDDRLISLLSQIPINQKVDNNNRKKIMVEICNGKIPSEIVHRRKYGFCSALCNVR